jgi:hypothetical protein
MAGRDRPVPCLLPPATRLLPLAAGAVALLLAFAGCLTSEPEVSTERDTLGDPLGDIAVLADTLYATNHDLSGHAGSQVDLFRLTAAGELDEAFDLGLNGAGYLAACSDGEAIYLQVRRTGRIFKVSPTGEILWTRLDPLAGPRRLACGLAYRADVDSFVTLYRDGRTSGYVSVNYGPEFIDQAGAEREHDLSLFDSPTGVLAAAWHDGVLWALGRDVLGQALVQGVSLDGWETRFLPLDDPTACGIAVLAGELVVAFEDRRIELVWPGPARSNPR